MLLAALHHKIQNGGWNVKKNACLPTAIAFKNGLKRSGVWSEVLRYGWRENNKIIGHAVTAYMYPPGKNQLWTYDWMGSYRTMAFKDNPLEVAKYSHRVRGYTNQIIFAEYLK